MSSTQNPNPLRAALFAASLAAEGEAKRLESLSDEEFLAEEKLKGHDAARVPTAEEFLERVKARAARQEQPATGRVVQAADVVADPVAPVVPIRRSSRLAWILAAAAVVLLIIAAANRPEIVALLHGEPGKVEPLPPPTSRELAEKLRHDALGNCEQGDWSTCRDLLDRAARLDPAGETEAQVQKLRADIARTNAPAPPKDDKPKP